MIQVFINTKRVYSYGHDMMPKFEIIEQSVTDGANWDKFLKYFQFKGYILKDLFVKKVLDVKVDKGKVIEEELDKGKWEDQLNAKISSLEKQPMTVQDSLKVEKERNDQLQKRLEALEAQLGNKRVEEGNLYEKIVGKSLESMTDEELASEYIEKYGKKPHHMAKRDTLIEKLK